MALSRPHSLSRAFSSHLKMGGGGGGQMTGAFSSQVAHRAAVQTHVEFSRNAMLIIFISQRNEPHHGKERVKISDAANTRGMADM